MLFFYIQLSRHHLQIFSVFFFFALEFRGGLVGIRLALWEGTNTSSREYTRRH